MGGKGSGQVDKEVALIRLDGHKIYEDGRIEKTSILDFLQTDLSDYSDFTITPEEFNKLKNHVNRMKYGISATMPRYCTGGKCKDKTCPLHDAVKKGHAVYPLFKQCHPPGTLIKLYDESEIPIEELDSNKHKVMSFERKRSHVKSNNKRGYSFRVGSRYFNGELIKLTAGNTSHEVTPNHICAVRLNDNAKDKFIVYLMRKGDLWRVGKTHLFRSSTDDKRYVGFKGRLKREEGDALWILGVYNTNTEASLAEEYFSVTWHTGKACFNILDSGRGKYNGLYKWVTKEQLTKHHESLKKPESFYREKLNSIGRDIDFPIWEESHGQRTFNDVKFYPSATMFIRACNIIPELMSVPVFPDTSKGYSNLETEWHPVYIEKRNYSGLVYFLDVENEWKTYFANNIATHNCWLEVKFIQSRMVSYMEEFNTDPESITEMSLINELISLDVQELRVNIGLSGSLNEEDAYLLHKNIVDNGQTIQEQTVIHPLVEIKDRISKRRQSILEALVATPREKYKKAAALKTSDGADLTTFFANASEKFANDIKVSSKENEKEKLDRIIDEVADIDPNIIEAEWEEKK